MFHNVMMGFVATLHLLGCGFDKGHQMFILFCLHPRLPHMDSLGHIFSNLCPSRNIL